MMVAVMVSHESREDVRARTLEQLRKVDVIPRVLISVNRDPSLADAEVRLLGGIACRIADAANAGLLFLEDDLLVDAHLFPRHVSMAESLGHPVTFCLLREALYPLGIRDCLKRKRPLPVSIVHLNGADADRGFHGSMAVYLPRAMTSYAAENPHDFMTDDGRHLTEPVLVADKVRHKVCGFDFWVKEVSASFGGLHAAIPNSIDHVHETSVRARLRGERADGGRERSGTFGWPTQ